MTPSKSTATAGFAAMAALIALSGAAATTPAFAKSSAKQVECFGVNACKGQSDCKTAKNDCKGMNDCKGQGFKSESAKQCAADGGSLTPPK